MNQFEDWSFTTILYNLADSFKMTLVIEVEDLFYVEDYKLTEDMIIQTFNTKPGLLQIPSTFIVNCTICLEDKVVEEKIARLKCKHLFHLDCLIKWMEISKMCPLCREEVEHSVSGEGAPWGSH